MNYFRVFSRFVFAVIFVTVVFSGDVFASEDGILSVTQIAAQKTYAVADGNYENGWQWIFDVTVPANETILKMKFADWTNGGNLIAAADNIRFYSEQSTNANDKDHAIYVSSANSYSGVMNIIPDASSDMDITKTGRQIKIMMEARVPTGSASGSYSTSYGINTEVDPSVSDSSIGDKENSITVTANATPASGVNLYESDIDIPIMGINIKANNSVMRISRVKLGFNANPVDYFKNISLVDGDKEVAKIDMNSNNVSNIGDNYTVTLGVTSNTIAEDTIKTIIVRLSARDMIDSNLSMPATIAINVAAYGVRVSDRDDLDNYGPSSSTAIVNNVTVNYATAQSSGAALTISDNANMPRPLNIIADSSQDITGATLMVFDIKATAANISLKSLKARFFAGAGGAGNYAIPKTAYLYNNDGAAIGKETPIAYGQADAGLVTFSGLNQVILKNTTKTFSIKFDDTVNVADSATRISSSDGQRYAVSVNGPDITARLSGGFDLFGSGLATSNNAFAYSQGPVFNLTSITTTSTQAPFSTASSTLSVTFNINVAAKSGDVYIANSGAFTVYKSIGGATSTVSDVTYVQPSNTVASGSNFKISDGNNATFAVNATFANAGVAGTYDLRIAEIKWGHVTGSPTAVTSSYMNGEAAWISPAVYLR